MSDPLTDDAIQAALRDLPGWSRDGDKLTKTFKFHSFREAISFIVRLSFEAEQLNHHPEQLNVYSTVTLSLSTHDAGGKVTQRDVDLATAVESFNWLGK